jgi:hypothetical protein
MLLPELYPMTSGTALHAGRKTKAVHRTASNDRLVKSSPVRIEFLQKKHEGMKQIPHLFALLDFIHNRNVHRQNHH